LFIDTWHQYEQLDQELNKHSNKVRKYIAFHDTHTYAINGEKCSNTSSGNILTDFKENPYGILFNPVSVINTLTEIMDLRKYNTDDLFQHNEQ
jgi:hypothetical protein